MRQLFLPACVCLVTWSGATNSDPRISLDEFTGQHSANKKYAAARSETTGSATAETLALRSSFAGDVADAVTPSAHPPETSSELIDAIAPALAPVAPISAAREPVKAASEPAADILANLAIEAPVPSGKVVNNGEPAGIPLPPIAKPVIARSEAEVCDALTAAAQRNDLPAPFFIRLLFQESGFKPGVVSAAGAQGVAQFMPATAADMGLDNPFDPAQAIPASARLLRDLFQQFGNLGLAAAAYNAGPKRIADWLANKGKNKLPEETQGYVKTITGKPVENWSAASARHPGMKLPRRAPCQEAAGLLAWNGPDAVPLPAPAPLRVAAAAELKKDSKSHRKAETKTAAKPTVKPATKTAAKVEAKPVPAQSAAQQQPKPKQKHERIAQR